MKPGDVVYLISGGPPMTVESQDPQSNKFDCVWFDEHGVNRAYFIEAVLTKSKREVKTTPYVGEDQCCFVSDEGVHCNQQATHWVGSNPVGDYTHVCADHIDDVKAEDDVVHELAWPTQCIHGNLIANGCETCRLLGESKSYNPNATEQELQEILASKE